MIRRCVMTLSQGHNSIYQGHMEFLCFGHTFHMLSLFHFIFAKNAALYR